MASKRSVQEWRQAVDVLTLSATEFSGVVDEILSILKFSYDSLDGEMAKSCFLYCSLFPEDDSMYKEELIEYWIGEGFIDEKEGRERAMNQGYEILGTLVRACLLLEDDEDESEVKMHDVVREMAIWIASDLGKHKERCIVKARAGLREIPRVENWKDARRISLMENGIHTICESPDCPQLITLLLPRNILEEISDGFFQSMPKLLVLDLSRNYLSGSRMDMYNLVSLRYLNLSATYIVNLPFGLERLKMLIHLNLEGTSTLESLEGISGLSSLRTLKLAGSRLLLDMRLMKELQLLQHIEYVTVSISTSTLAGEKLFDDPRMGRCIQQVSICGEEESVKVLVLPALDGLRDITIWGCGMLEEIKIEKTPGNKSLTSPCFSNLTQVYIESCYDLLDLTWLLFAPNLTHLYVSGARQLEEIISKEKAGSVLSENNIIPFQKLEMLTLRYLPELKSIYWNALPFQRLRLVDIIGSYPKLRKLPLNSKSVFDVEKLVIQCPDEEWLERVEWEDEATRLRFLPSCKIF